MVFGGVGFAGMSYPTDFQELVDEIEALPGVDRNKVHVNLGIGFAPHENLFFTGTINGYVDRYEYESSSEWEELILAFAHVAGGIRWYPQTTGWVFGIDLGPAAGSITFDASYLDSEIEETSDTGFGGGAMLGYDFSRRKTGFSAIVGGRLDSYLIEEEAVSFMSLFLNLVLK